MSVWNEVVGQPQAVETLQRAVRGSVRGSEDQQAFTNSWLITGPPGSGRSTAAYAFAAALLCPNGGCGTCDSCIQVRQRSHPDLTAVVTETLIITIDTARELVARASRSPMNSNYRVIVVEDADRMMERTSNTLLKAIEEPEPTTVWVLCAPSVTDLLPTIRSRVRTIGLHSPAVEDVAALLVRRHAVTEEVALRAAAESQSHVGMAARLVTTPAAWERRDRALNGVLGLRTVGDAVRKAAEWVAIADEDGKAAAEDRDEKERQETFRSLGLDPNQTIPRQLRGVFRELEENQKRRAKRATLDGVDRILTDVQSLWRDTLMLQLDAGVRLVNETRRPEIESAARSGQPSSTMASIESISLVRERLAANVPPTLALEGLLVGYVARQTQA
ncbi:DNA polymerase III subunit delta' [Gulosibacter molinativorax]|uniref:DNA polymerase III subunit delta n=1 Tax=Gulosibacter molinativorax TaxID=256821 RepID=A0ABT7CAX4_9MICO|nr:DNA polymerase III subunit delta' [Gulosibacter molinativorax]MDJ1372366.1 DNA polymerase III subunit delta' [Gulosibacter molinativorax]QUY63545.1 DNA polymerase III, delta' subunit [Gulosibacter molinativorax]